MNGNKSDSVIITPTGIQLVGYIICKDYWVIADQTSVYTYTKNELTLRYKYSTDYEILYLQYIDGYIVIQTKQGMITIIDSEFKEFRWFHIKLFCFCRLVFLGTDYYYMDESEQQLIQGNIQNEQQTKLNIKSTCYASCLNVQISNKQIFITIAYDGGNLELYEQIEGEYKLKRNHNIVAIDQPGFIYDCQTQILESIQIYATTNLDMIYIFSEQGHRTIKTTISANQIQLIDLNKANTAIVVSNKDQIQIISQQSLKAICNFKFLGISCMQLKDNMIFISQRDGIMGQIDLNYLRKQN